MQASLPTRRSAGLVLAWFVAFLLVAGFAPWVQAQPPDVCTVAVDEGGHGGSDPAVAHATHTLQCALCALVFTPPPAAAPPVRPDAAGQVAVAALGGTPPPLLARAPLPARGPPPRS